jgi:hypothetical protein
MLLVLMLSLPAAAQIENLREASAPVASQSDEDRAAAFASALEQVVVGFTGREDAVPAARTAGVLENPERFVQQYRYQADDSGQLHVVARFDGTALREALADAGIPVWQPDRPPVLVWLAADTGAGRDVIGGDDTLRQALQEAAGRYGVPLMFPLLDLQDQQRVSVSDISGGFPAPIIEASRRYGTPVVLIGSLRRDGSLVRGRWTLLIDGRGDGWQGVAGSRQELIQQAMAELAQRLRDDYTVLATADSGEELRLWVAGVDDLAGYTRAERVLRGVPGVEDVSAEEIVGDRVHFRLELSVSRERAQRELSRSTLLVPTMMRAGDGTTAAGARVVNDPVYRLRP